MDFVNCPICRQKGVPVGEEYCDLCGWTKGGNKAVPAAEKVESSAVEAQPLETKPVVSQKSAKVSDKPAEKTKSGKKIAPCAACGETKAIVARGLGSCCYFKEKAKPDFDVRFPAKSNAGRKQEKPHTTEAKESKPSPVEKKAKTDNSIKEITVRFYPRDKDLLKDIQKEAHRNRRSPSQEVLFRLDQSSQFLNQMFGGQQ